MKQALAGIRVIDFGWYGVSPAITRYLADFGATVIKIESTTAVDPTRTTGPYKNGQPGFERSGFFSYLNRNKYSITLNLNHPKGPEVAKRLVAWADIVAENFTVRVLKKWGLSYEELIKVNPRIIMISCSAYGRTGPYRDYLGLGPAQLGATGMVYVTGWPDRTPVGPGFPYLDWIASHFGAVAILSALDFRQRTGGGQYIDLSMIEMGIYGLETALLDYAVNGRIQNRAGNRLTIGNFPVAAPHGVYPCQGHDRWCAIAVFTDDEWQSFCKVIGNPPWIRDAKFGSLLSRLENIEELDHLVEEWTINHQAEEVMYMMQTAGVAAGVVQSVRDLAQDPQLKHRQHSVLVDHPEVGFTPYEAPGYRLSKTPYELRPAPCLGQHNEYVHKELLGISDEEYEQLLNEGVFE